jgi:putative SOS response-associated peptidase YedK
MCGRYLTPDQAALERAWELRAPAGYRQSYNLAPSQLAPVLSPIPAGGMALEMLVWGFKPHWAKRGWINARTETVFTSRAFAPAARRNRCLVPAIGWYEWQGEKAPRQPWLFHLDGFRAFAFAGIRTQGGDEEPASFAILTTRAAEGLEQIHGRMPLVLDPADHARWLDAECPPDEAAGLLSRHASSFEFYKVSPYVNKPEHNDASCIRPI